MKQSLKFPIVLVTSLVLLILFSLGIVRAVGVWSNPIAPNDNNIYFLGGKVGIGTATPSNILDVGESGSGRTAGHFVVDEVNDKVFVGKLSATGGENTANFIVRNRTANELLNLNINTGTFDLNTYITNKVNGNNLTLANLSGRSMTISRNSGGADTGSWTFNTGDDFTFMTDNVARLKIDNNGVHAREIRVNNTWADYVFEDNYSLMSLSDLDKFIKVNGHLPNIPEAEEIEESGISLGEMSRLQMENNSFVK